MGRSEKRKYKAQIQKRSPFFPFCSSPRLTSEVENSTYGGRQLRGGTDMVPPRHQAVTGERHVGDSERQTVSVRCKRSTAWLKDTFGLFCLHL